MPSDLTSKISGWGNGVIFGQIYHTPYSKLIFRLSGISNGDYVDLSDYFQEVYSVHATPNSDANNTADTLSVTISGTYPNNTGTVVIFNDPLAGVIYDFEVIGHKAECGDAFE